MISIDIQTSDNYYHADSKDHDLAIGNRKEKLLGIYLAFDPVIIRPTTEENVFEREFKLDSRIEGNDNNE
jgi:hypothetical protein